jgi:hypothetical protein
MNMIRKLKNLLICFALTALLGACGEPSLQAEVPLLSFEQYKPVMLNVAAIEIVDKFRPIDPTGGAKHVELLMKQPPHRAVQELIRKQLVPAGPSGLLRVIIDDASVLGEKLPVTEGMAGLFQNEPAERYHATVALRFERAAEDAPDLVTASANVAADRTTTVMKDASPADRDMAFYRLNEQLMADVSQGLQTVVRSSFGLQ